MVTTGDWLGEAMGLAEGTKLGLDEGDTVGATVGLVLGGLVGEADGLEVVKGDLVGISAAFAVFPSNIVINAFTITVFRNICCQDTYFDKLVLGIKTDPYHSRLPYFEVFPIDVND